MLTEMTVKQFLQDLGSAAPVPGGGSASALAAALAGNLYLMVVEVTLAKEPDKAEVLGPVGQRLRALSDECAELVQADADAYDSVMQAYRLPKKTDEEKAARADQIQVATRKATLVPLQLAEKVMQLMQSSEEVARLGRMSCISDAGVGNCLALAAVMGGLLNVETNLPSLKDEEFVRATTGRVSALQEQCRQAFDRLQQVVMDRMYASK